MIRIINNNYNLIEIYTVLYKERNTISEEITLADAPRSIKALAATDLSSSAASKRGVRPL